MELHTEKSLGMEEEKIGLQQQTRKQGRGWEDGLTGKGFVEQARGYPEVKQKAGCGYTWFYNPYTDRDSRIAGTWAAYLKFSERPYLRE